MNSKELKGQINLSIAELTYFKQLKEEIESFLKTTFMSSVEGVVIGIKGKNFEALIPIHKN